MPAHAMTSASPRQVAKGAIRLTLREGTQRCRDRATFFLSFLFLACLFSFLEAAAHLGVSRRVRPSSGKNAD
jgi:hypothetical protein